MIHLEPIDTIHHPLLIDALAIYQEAFPFDEQMSVVFWLKTLLALPSATKQCYAITDDTLPGTALGFVYLECTDTVAYLWYLCVLAAKRGQGTGSAAYQSLVAALFARGMHALVFEVEKPERAGETAARRIAFYQRNGARLLSGIDYQQTVDNGSAPVPMHLLVHTPQEVTAPEAYRLACMGLGKTLPITGTLALEKV